MKNYHFYHSRIYCIGVMKMVKYILYAVVLLLALSGLAEVLNWLKCRLIAPKKKAHTCSVLYLTDDDARQQMIFAAEQRLWHGKGYADDMIAVGDGLESSTEKACRFIAEKYGIVYCRRAELSVAVDALFEEAKNKA